MPARCRAPAGWLRGAQNADGGWGIQPRAPSESDSTGAALQGLVAAGGERPGDRRRGRPGCARRSAASGGCALGGSGVVNSQSTAWAVQGLAAAGGGRRARSTAALGYLVPAAGRRRPLPLLGLQRPDPDLGHRPGAARGRAPAVPAAGRRPRSDAVGAGRRRLRRAAGTEAPTLRRPSDPGAGGRTARRAVGVRRRRAAAGRGDGATPAAAPADPRRPRAPRAGAEPAARPTRRAAPVSDADSDAGRVATTDDRLRRTATRPWRSAAWYLPRRPGRSRGGSSGTAGGCLSVAQPLAFVGDGRRDGDPQPPHPQGLPARSRRPRDARRAARARPLGAQPPPDQPVALPRPRARRRSSG